MHVCNRFAFSMLLLLACNSQALDPSGPSPKPANRSIGHVPPTEIATWKQYMPAVSPSARIGYGMAYYPPTGKTYVFGGSEAMLGTLGDMWSWDGANWAKVATGVGPGARNGGALAYDAGRGSLIFYGGIGTTGLDQVAAGAFTDTWEWTPSEGWAKLAPVSNPGTVFNHALASDTTRAKIVLYGGEFYDSIALPSSNTTRWRDDVWEWDGAAVTWTKRTAVASSVALGASLRSSPPLFTYDGARRRFSLYAPVQTSYGTTFKLVEWDSISGGWADTEGQDGLGNVNSGARAMAYDPVRRRQVLFIDDWQVTQVWEVDSRGPTWYVRDPTNAPPSYPSPRSMVYDSGRACMVLWEPLGEPGPQLWEYQVSHWTNGEGCTAASAGACASGNCVDGVCCASASCTGTCRSCNVLGSEGTCALAKAGSEIPDSCGDNQACDATGACKAKNGQTCTDATACASGFCADGVCCDSACTGPCVACNLSGQTGTCRPHPSGTDPQSDCSATTGTCQSTCDGAGSCAYPKDEASCGGCLTCDGFGACTAYDHQCVTITGATPNPDCYVDSVGGDDGKSGLTQSEAVKSQAKLPASCGAVYFKRGSFFGEKLRVLDQATTYASYGDGQAALPKFVVPRTKGSGPVISAMGKQFVTFDGLSISGATGDGTLAGQADGVCVALGYADTLTNSEITGCDTGVELYDQSNIVQGNYIHDLDAPLGPPADPYLSGAATGVVVRGGGNITWNTFVNCKGTLTASPGSGCYGGAIDVAVPKGDSNGQVWVNHNYAFGNCSFAAVGSYRGDAGLGDYSSLSYDYNMVVDSGPLALLDVVSSNLSYAQFSNNTVVQHQGSPNAGKLFVLYAGASSAAPQPFSVSVSCNLFALEGVAKLDGLLDENFWLQTNLVMDMAKQDPGFVNDKGSTPQDYDLVKGSPAIDACGKVFSPEDVLLDFFNRTAPAPSSQKLDIGACEYGALPGNPTKFFPGTGGSSVATGTGGVGGAGGTTTAAGGAGGSSATASATGGASGSTTLDAGSADVGQATDTADAGAEVATGVASGTGGASGVGGTTLSIGAGGVIGAGGAGGTTANADADSATALSTGGIAGGTGGSTGTTRPTTGLHHGCSCDLGQGRAGAGITLLIVLTVFCCRRWRRSRRDSAVGNA